MVEIVVNDAREKPRKYHWYEVEYGCGVIVECMGECDPRLKTWTGWVSLAESRHTYDQEYTPEGRKFRLDRVEVTKL